MSIAVLSTPDLAAASGLHSTILKTSLHTVTKYSMLHSKIVERGTRFSDLHACIAAHVCQTVVVCSIYKNEV